MLTNVVIIYITENNRCMFSYLECYKVFIYWWWTVILHLLVYWRFCHYSPIGLYRWMGKNRIYGHMLINNNHHRHRDDPSNHQM